MIWIKTHVHYQYRQSQHMGLHFVVTSVYSENHLLMETTNYNLGSKNLNKWTKRIKRDKTYLHLLREVIHKNGENLFCYMYIIGGTQGHKSLKLFTNSSSSVLVWSPSLPLSWQRHINQDFTLGHIFKINFMKKNWMFFGYSIAGSN